MVAVQLLPLLEVLVYRMLNIAYFVVFDKRNVKKSDIEVAHELGVLLDELTARLDLVAHEDGE